MCACTSRRAMRPIERCRRAEAKCSNRSPGIPLPLHVARKLIRPVDMVEIDGKAYSVPWRLIGKTVRSVVVGGAVRTTTGSRGRRPRGRVPAAGVRHAHALAESTRAIDPATSQLGGVQTGPIAVGWSRSLPLGSRQRCCGLGE
jgi:hypothetical protein